MKNKLVSEGGCTMIFKRNEERNEKRNGKGTRQEQKHHMLKRNEAGTKTAFIEKERGRNEIVNLEERPMP